MSFKAEFVSGEYYIDLKLMTVFSSFATVKSLPILFDCSNKSSGVNLGAISLILRRRGHSATNWQIRFKHYRSSRKNYFK